MQIREAELYRREVSPVQRRRTGGEAGAQGQHILRLRELSQVPVHFCQQAACRKVPELRQRLSGRKESESGPRHHLPEQRMRLRTAAAAAPGASGYERAQREQLTGWHPLVAGSFLAEAESRPMKFVIC